MAEGPNGFAKELNVKWIRTESGAIFLCPVAVLDFIDDLTEDELRSICVEVVKEPYVN